MKFSVIKTIFCLVVMIAFLIMAFISSDASNEQLFASLGIITGAFTTKFISTQNTTIDEKF